MGRAYRFLDDFCAFLSHLLDLAFQGDLFRPQGHQRLPQLEVFAFGFLLLREFFLDLVPKSEYQQMCDEARRGTYLISSIACIKCWFSCSCSTTLLQDISTRYHTTPSSTHARFLSSR
jgi:hypothetical protein